MTCEKIRQLLPAYIDDELDLATALEIEKHLPDCPDCRRELEASQAVRAAAQSAAYFPAPSALRDRLKRAIRDELGESAGVSADRIRRPWWKRPMLVSGLAAALLLVVALTAMVLPARSPDLAVAEVVASHVRSLQADHLLDVPSTDQHTVKPWFNGKIEFAPPVIDLSGEGFPLVGGRLDYVQDRKVAALIYRRDKHLINLFIWPGDSSLETQTRDGFNLIRFQCNGMVCWAVSDLNAAELQHFANLFKAQKSASNRS